MGADVQLFHVATTSELDVPTTLSLLTPEERTRHDALRFERDRRTYLVTRALERAVLAAALGISPTAVRLRRTDLGRPVLEGSVDLRFSLTNTHRLVACATTRGQDVGLDAEPLDRGPEILALAPSVFTRDERERLRTFADEPRAAVELWTAKEAYLKLRGLGLSLPPEHVEIALRSGEPPELRVAPDEEARPDGLRFVASTIAGHVVTLCVRAALHPNVTVHEVHLNGYRGAGGSR